MSTTMFEDVKESNWYNSRKDIPDDLDP